MGINGVTGRAIWSPAATKPRTEASDLDRIFSADQMRSIRFGSHEMSSIGTTKAHFHCETWSYNAAEDIMTVTNTLQRIR